MAKAHRPITPLQKIACLLVLLLASAGCQSALLPGSRPEATATDLTIAVTPLGNGEFELTGTTNLADNTPLTAVALRYLAPPTAASPGDDAPYSLLDYEPVTVADGTWSARLTTWQISPEGRYQEAWQAQAETLNLAVQPRDTVQFAVTLAPQHLGSALKDTLAESGRRRLAALLRVTPVGEPFLWADQSLPVALPTGQTTPPADLLARTNGGWGERYRLVPEPPLPYELTPDDQRQTTAPLSPGELLR
ncbi:MAG TPA: hypothetical protein VLS96_16540 [Nodosilinea sp.]|nr:hypothetical protein [Nodosilinea sp.]